MDMYCHGLKPDAVTYRSLINGLCKVGKISAALEIHDQMLEDGIIPSVTTYNIILKAMLRTGVPGYSSERRKLSAIRSFKNGSDIFDGIFTCYAVVLAIFVVVAETEWGFVVKFWKAETDREAGANKGVSDKQIHLKIFSPNVLDITLVDLPDITKFRLDIIDRGTDARNFLLGKVIPLKLGYVGVVNRSQEDIMLNRSVKDALVAEEKFFRSHPLAKKLNQILVQHIRAVLPSLKISTQLVYVAKEHASYGETVESKGAWISCKSWTRSDTTLFILVSIVFV
ncbi:hypothetical protein Nepgr_022724 [Nepenthes gracilis]|uniref:Dynamin GTPase domain-containing protein n=1 Tax=Nepenthes gracilis TaxID=150966 RepID=A0AAD3T2L2_NEPGR|nr:hypothetical protein Nepgr_022724 [Nepenthes gracilis]